MCGAAVLGWGTRSRVRFRAHRTVPVASIGPQPPDQLLVAVVPVGLPIHAPPTARQDLAVALFQAKAIRPGVAGVRAQQTRADPLVSLLAQLDAMAGQGIEPGVQGAGHGHRALLEDFRVFFPIGSPGLNEKMRSSIPLQRESPCQPERLWPRVDAGGSGVGEVGLPAKVDPGPPDAARSLGEVSVHQAWRVRPAEGHPIFGR